MGAACIIVGGIATPTWGAERVLGLRPFQWLGLVSYSFYLWHWPILTLAAQSQGETSLPAGKALLWVLLSLVLAIGTYLVVENPIRHSTYLVARRAATMAVGGGLIIASLCVTTFAAGPSSANVEANVAIAPSGYPCVLPSKANIAALRNSYEQQGGKTVGRKSSQELRVVVVGDSTACTMLPGLTAVGPSYGVQFGNGAVIGCGIVSGTVAPLYLYGENVHAFTRSCQHKADDAEKSAIRRDKPNVIVWASTDEADSIVANTPSGNEELTAGSPQWKTVMKQRIDSRIQQFISNGTKVILLLQPPFVDEGHSTKPTAHDVAFERMNSMLVQASKMDPNDVKVIDLASLVCPSGPPCSYLVEGLSLRPDNFHYGAVGTLWVAKWLVPRIVADSS